MSQLSKEIGKQIKYYRKKRHMSAEALSAKIFKGTSTLYKYENGSIAIDVDTLESVSLALNVPLIHFFQTKDQELPSVSLLQRNPFGTHSTLYLYGYIGKRILYSQLQMFHTKESGHLGCSLLFDVPSFQEMDTPAQTYIGDMDSFDFVTYFTLSSALQPSERLSLCVLNPWNQSGKTWGLMFGVLNYSILPTACKLLVSTEPIPNSELQLDELCITKEELKQLKTYNMFYLGQAQGLE